jgi:hypothetical protein
MAVKEVLLAAATVEGLKSRRRLDVVVEEIFVYKIIVVIQRLC